MVHWTWQSSPLFNRWFMFYLQVANSLVVVWQSLIMIYRLSKDVFTWLDHQLIWLTTKSRSNFGDNRAVWCVCAICTLWALVLSCLLSQRWFAVIMSGGVSVVANCSPVIPKIWSRITNQTCRGRSAYLWKDAVSNLNSARENLNLTFSLFLYDNIHAHTRLQQIHLPQDCVVLIHYWLIQLILCQPLFWIWKMWVYFVHPITVCILRVCVCVC